MPARTRSEMSERSNSAIAEMTVNMALPMGEEVSICSVRDLFGEGDEVDAQVPELLERIDELYSRAGKAIKLPDEHGVHLPAAHGLPEPVELATLGDGPRHIIDELVREWEAPMADVRPEFAELHLRVLVRRRDAGIDRGARLMGFSHSCRASK